MLFTKYVSKIVEKLKGKKETARDCSENNNINSNW